MENKKRQEIIKNTNKFYKSHAEEFSKTRQSRWQGWKNLLPIIKEQFSDKDAISVLDLGCGNARFYTYLKENIEKDLQYMGIDNNDFMMIEAIMKYPDAKFQSLDVIGDVAKIEGRYSLVVAFGLTHHIPGKEFRLKWFESVLERVNDVGIAVFTFWNLQTDKRFAKAEIAQDLETNDFYYGWGNSKDKRYVHIYDEKEIRKLSEMFKNKGFKLRNTYDADGKNGRMNTYLILQAA